MIGHRQLHLGFDHQPLLGILGPKKDITDQNNHRLTEFARKINNFQPFIMQHILGLKNKSADTGSRAPVHDSEVELNV